MTEYFPYLLILMGLISGFAAWRSVVTGVNGLADNNILREKQPHAFWAATVLEGLLGISVIILGIRML